MYSRGYPVRSYQAHPQKLSSGACDMQELRHRSVRMMAVIAINKDNNEEGKLHMM
jgi:hypothetical protein